MSIAVMTEVWKNSKAEGSVLLLLLAIADFCHNDDGTGAYPSIETLSRKTRMSERNVQYLIQKAETLGELKVDRAEGRGNTNLYTIVIKGANIAPKEKVQNSAGKGANQREEKVQGVAPESLVETNESVSQAIPTCAPPAKHYSWERPIVQDFPKSTIDSNNKKEKPPKPPPRDLPIAVQSFFKIRHHLPKRDHWKIIQDTVGCEKSKLDFWEQILERYDLLNWNPMNIYAQLEWFKRGELPHDERHPPPKAANNVTVNPDGSMYV